MLNKGSTDTKAKILEAAFELFGRFGYEGTSVRAISKQSGVNLAAINYHFKNKDNLFWEIMGHTYRELDQTIAELAKESKSTVELAMKTFDYFQKEQYALKNAMKMMLDEGINAPESEEIRQVLANPMGPPGGLYFAEIIQKEVPYPLSQVGLIWGVKSVFGSVFHWSVMLCSTRKTCALESDPMMAPELIREDVKQMVEASLLFLKHNQANFSQNKIRSKKKTGVP